jgi:hypothetical protein
MATFVAWDDWWVSILDIKDVDLGPSTSMPRTRVMGTVYHVRLGWRASTIALVNCDRPSPGHTPDQLDIRWLRPDAAFRFQASARSWWETLGGVDPNADVLTVRSQFLRMLVHATAELQGWPGMAIVGASASKAEPGPGVESPPSRGTVDINGAQHRMTGWVNGQLFYTSPDGREFEVTASSDLLEKVVFECANHFGSGVS